MARLMDIYQIREPLRQAAQRGMAVWGTCAGMILMAKRIVQDRLEPLGLMDIEVHRNAYGRQVDSFEANIQFPALGEPDMRCVFIRAPKIESVGQSVAILGRLPEGGIVAAQQNKFLVTAFHPELTLDGRFHEYFLRLVASPQ